MKSSQVKIWLSSIAICILLAGNSLSFSQDAKSHRVLFFGNSVFYHHGGLYQSFEGFCKTAGLDYQAISQRNTPDNPHGVEFLNFGRIPLSLPEIAANDEIHELILSGNFDYVIVEARRVGYLLPPWVKLPESGNYGQHIAYEHNIAALGKIHRTIVESGAKTVLYMHPGAHSLADYKHAVAQIYMSLHADLEKMQINGKQHEVILAPASLLWLDALNRYGVDGWYADHIHGNPLARYTSACMLYTYLTGKDPRQNSFRELPRSWEISPDQVRSIVSEEDARWIKDQVWLYYSTRP